MRRICSYRRRVSSVLVVLLLFAQFVTAAYACPEFVAQQQAAAMADMPDCQGPADAVQMDPEQPLLCKASCDQDVRSSSPAHTALPDAPVLLYVVAEPVAHDLAYTAPPVSTRVAGEAPPGWPPLYLFNHILRN